MKEKGAEARPECPEDRQVCSYSKSAWNRRQHILPSILCPTLQYIFGCSSLRILPVSSNTSHSSSRGQISRAFAYSTCFTLLCNIKIKSVCQGNRMRTLEIICNLGLT